MFIEACFGQIRFRICFVLLDMLSIVLFVLGMSTVILLWKPGDGPCTPPPYLRALEIENRRTAPELQQHNNELFSLQMYVITSSVSQVRIPKFVRVLYGVRSVSQRFSTLLLNCSALCELNSFFYSLCLNHASECPPKQTVGPKMAVFRPFHRGKKVPKRCWNISIYICVLCLSSFSEIQQNVKHN